MHKNTILITRTERTHNTSDKLVCEGEWGDTKITMMSAPARVGVRVALATALVALLSLSIPIAADAVLTAGGPG